MYGGGGSVDLSGVRLVDNLAHGDGGGAYQRWAHDADAATSTCEPVGGGDSAASGRDGDTRGPRREITRL